MGDTHRVHGFDIPDHYPRKFYIVAFLDRRRSGVANWNYPGRATATNTNGIDYSTTTDLAHGHWLARSTNGDGSRAVATEILFYLSLHSNLPYGIAVFQHHGDRPRPSWLGLYAHAISHSQFSNEESCCETLQRNNEFKDDILALTAISNALKNVV